MAEFCRVQRRVVAVDHAGLFKEIDPAKAGRRRETDRGCQLDIRYARVFLKPQQDLAVDPVHERPL